MKYKKKRLHEDNLRNELCTRCRQEGIRVVLEYWHKDSRFDAVIIREGEVLAIIEVKNWARPQALRTKQNPTEQIKKYRKYGLPVLILWRFYGLKYLMRRIRRIVDLYDNQQKTAENRILFYPRVTENREPTGKNLLEKLIKQQAKDDRTHMIWKKYA